MSQTWFESKVVVSRAKLMRALAKQRDRDARHIRLRGANIIDMEAWKYPRVGQRIFYIDRDETFFVTRDLQRILDIDKATVYKWVKIGLIPPPIMTKLNHYEKETRYWVRPQIKVVALVVNDLRRQGLLRFTKDRIGAHIEMVKVGNEIELKAWHKRREQSARKKTRKAVRWTS